MGNSALAQEVTQHLHDNVLNYYPDLDGLTINVRLIDEQHRPFSSLYRFQVQSPRESHNIFVKGIPLDNSQYDEDHSQESRARLAPMLPDAGERTWLEYEALKIIDDHFQNLGDPRFGTIHVLDYIDNPQTIIMEESSDPSLRFLFAKNNQLNSLLGKSPGLLRAFSNTGAWLRTYSEMPKTENIETRHTHRDDFKKTVVNFTDFLGQLNGDASYFQRVEKETITAADEIIPDKLPLGLGHGDYAMRNILVGENDRITAFDTGAKWRVPIYEDIAYFLVQLETNRLQILTQGLAFHDQTLAAYRREFLAGYFGELPAPVKLIKLFQLQLLLDRWSSRSTAYNRHSMSALKAYRRLYPALIAKQYKKIIDRLLTEIGS
ncbi:MAG: hypothetical protein V7746_00865 [Halioglobus sp.]